MLISDINNIRDSKLDKQYITDQSQFVNHIAAVSADILYVMDINNKNILYSNREIGKVLGYNEDELLGITNQLFYFMHKDDVEAMVQHVENMRFAEDKEVREIEYRMHHKDGSIRWYIDRNTVFKRDNEGLAIEKLGISQDITEKKKIDIELKQANNSIVKQNIVLEQRNQELLSLSQVASEDLKEPLKKIYTAVEAIITGDAKNLSDNGRAHLRRLQSAVQRMGLITDDLLSYTRLTENNVVFSKVNLNEVLKESILRLKKIIEQKNASIESADFPAVYGNHDLLVTLFKNIIQNALKFQRNDNIPQIKVDCIIQTDHQNINYLRISFTDNGIGFNQNDAAKMFNLFTKLHEKEKYGGSGSGLAISKKIMEIHKGTIDAISNEGEGTEILCIFPLQSITHK